MSEFQSSLLSHLKGICELSQPELLALERHYDLLRRWNEKINLTSLRHPADIIVRHYCESLALGACLPNVPLRIADIGSGAGFPGFPVAVLRTDCAVTLVESHSRKCVFLRESTRDLKNIRVVEARAEQLQQRFDWVIARAVNCRRLSGSLAHLGENIGLLTSRAVAAELVSAGRILWHDLIPLPWGSQGVILLGRVSRGTSG